MVIGDIKTDPNNNPYILVSDPWGSLFQIVEANDWFRTKEKKLTGGVCGAQVGVSNMDKSLKFYTELLGFNKVVYDKTDVFNDLTELSGGKGKCRRVLLERNVENTGAFSKLLGKGQIELIQVLDRAPKKIFENRFWGDLGFIHLCFDVRNMKELELNFAKHGYPFPASATNLKTPNILP